MRNKYYTSIYMSSVVKNIIDALGIDETYTKVKKDKNFDKVKNHVFPKEDYNFMCDLLFLPETKKKNKYLLVMIDLYTDELDAEPLKTKEAKETLEAMKTIFKRSYLDKPHASIRCDDGGEFKGVFAKWCHDNNILLRYGLPHRHKQQANVERANRTIGRILNGYMNMFEIKTGEQYNEWDTIIKTVIKSLNNKQKRKDLNPYKIEFPEVTMSDAKYKVGDIVIRKLEVPYSALGHQQNTTNFREGDMRWDVKNPRRIKRILNYPNNIRYIIEGFANVSYVEHELMKAKDNVVKYEVKQIIGKKTIKKIVYYLIWWKRFLKKDATWEKRVDLLVDGLAKELNEYDENN